MHAQRSRLTTLSPIVPSSRATQAAQWKIRRRNTTTYPQKDDTARRRCLCPADSSSQQTYRCCSPTTILRIPRFCSQQLNTPSPVIQPSPHTEALRPVGAKSDELQLSKRTPTPQLRVLGCTLYHTYYYVVREASSGSLLNKVSPRLLSSSYGPMLYFPHGTPAVTKPRDLGLSG